MITMTMSREAVLNKIASLHILEYGIYHVELYEVLKEKANVECLVAALNNCDTEGVLLQILQQDPQRVFDGMQLAAYAVGATRMVLHIPEYATQIAEEIRNLAAENGIEIEVGIVNPQACESSVVCHMVTMAELSDVFAGQRIPGIYVSVNGAPVKKVPADTKLYDLLDMTDIKAIQTGYCIRTPDATQMTVEEANIENGVLRQLTSKDCIVAEVDKQLVSWQKQSCGKCVFCREGLIQLEGMHRDMTQNKGKIGYMELTSEIGEAMAFSTLCSMGQKASEFTLSATKSFQKEYEDHIRKKRCPANVCLAFMNIYIDPYTCTGCGDCMDVCSVDCIDGRSGYIHMIDDFDCTKCGRCVEVCNEKAIVQTTGRVPKLPDRLIRVGKFKRY